MPISGTGGMERRYVVTYDVMDWKGSGEVNVWWYGNGNKKK